MIISPKVGFSGAVLLGFTMFACGTPNTVTQGTVVKRHYDPAHAKTKTVCTVRIKSQCVKSTKKPNGWDDADYELQLNDGRNVGWIEVDNAAIFSSCPVGVKYPGCVTSN